MGKPIIVIVVPTCSGKTSIGIKLAKKLSGEIISADSRQIYKLLNIGTATPTNLELQKVKHHYLNSDSERKIVYYKTKSYEKIKNNFLVILLQ